MDNRRRLMDVALGKTSPDTIITKGVLIDVATRRLIKDVNISISGGRIASISKEKLKAGPLTRIIARAGKLATSTARLP